MGNTPRLGLHYPELTDIADVPADMHTLALGLDSAIIYGQGILANRPVSNASTPGIQGRVYRSTDETPNVVYLDTGTGWIPIGSIAPGSIGTVQLADRSVTSIKIALATILAENVANGAIGADQMADLSITAGKLVTALKPSQGAGADTEALRALGAQPGRAAAGIHALQHAPGGGDPLDAVVATVPLGAVVDFPYASGSIPAWSLLPVGQVVNRSAYAGLSALAGAAGYPHGAGDGVNTFQLPDYRGRVGVGKDDMGNNAASRITIAVSGISGGVLGAVGGAEGITLTTAQIPAHTHGGTTGGPSSNVPEEGGASSIGTGIGPWNLNSRVHTHTFTTAAAGSGGAHPNVQPMIVVNKIMRVL